MCPMVAACARLDKCVDCGLLVGMTNPQLSYQNDPSLKSRFCAHEALATKLCELMAAA